MNGKNKDALRQNKIKTGIITLKIRDEAPQMNKVLIRSAAHSTK